MKLRKKLMIVYLGLALAPLLFLGVTVYVLARQTLIRETLDNLDGTASRLRITLEDLADRDAITIAALSNETRVKNVFGESATSTAAARTMLALPATLAREQLLDSNMRTLSVLDMDGKIVASTDEKRVGEDHAGEAFFESGKTSVMGNLYFKDQTGDVLQYLSAPVRDTDGKVVGVVVDEHYPRIVLALTSSPAGLGETGEVLLVKREANGDATFMLPTRFDPNAASVRKISHDDAKSALIRAFNGDQGVFTDVVDYRGERIFTSSRYIDNLGLGLEIKIDRTEALAPMRNIALGTLAAILLAAAFILIVTVYVSKSIADPIVALTAVTNQISLGKLDVKFASSEAKDEIGDLYRTFERILVSLKLAMRGTAKAAKGEPEKKA